MKQNGIQLGLLDKNKLTTNEINRLIGIKENYELPEKLFSILFDEEKKEKLFDNLIALNVKLENDFMRDYFQQEQSNRSALKQDYTPDSICKIISGLQEENNLILDVCSGTGALSLFVHNKNKNIKFQCEELSQNALSILLFNLAIRNIESCVIKKNILDNNIEAIYKLEKGEKYCQIKKIDELETNTFDTIISNPPYSLSWEQKNDYRFDGYELAPKSKADYVFILDAISRLSNNGKAFFILPHGVLFRGANEEKIRTKLIENNLIEAVIGLPNKMFLNTAIPTCIIIFNKNKKDKNILFIDASKEFESQSKQNLMNDEQIEKIINTYKTKNDIDKYSKNVSYEEIQKNDYNLNIPRYVENYEKEKIPELDKTINDIVEIDKEIKKTHIELASMFKEIGGTNDTMDEFYQKNIKKLIELFGE